ncbi:MAG: hypothetical protein PHV39_09795, partial [Methanomicrobium sp.]|nr:hypothetical protein [Methanomicrobium sp.]
EIIRHEDIDVDTDIIPVFKQMIGDEKYEKNKENYFIYLFDSQNSPLTTVAHIVEGSGGAKSYMGEVQICINRASGKAVVYGDRLNSEEFFMKAFTLSPTPKITLDEAKSILEAKIDELYPGEPQKIEYAKGVSAENAGGLFWLDSSSYMNIQGDYLLSPVPLAWGILYITEETRGWGGSGRIWAAIDANNGEILSFYNERIEISGKSYD